MDFTRSRIFLAAIAVCFAFAGAGAAWAQCPASPNFATNFSSDQACLSLNGSAQLYPAGEPQVLRVNPAQSHTAGSAWFTSKQQVANGFSTTFDFRFTSPASTPADGIAFVIQNSSSTALANTFGDGGTLGYGDRDSSTNPSSGTGIPNSLAIEFDSFQNNWDADANHVAVQSCGVGGNTSHHNQVCSNGGANSTLGRVAVPSPLFPDGSVHRVTISYAPPSCANCTGSLHVVLDGTDLFPSGVSVNLATLLNLDNGAAYAGFTGATGGSWENQDIVTWTFTPTSQTTQVTTGQNSVVPFQNNAYTYEAQLNTGTPVTAQVTPILMDPTACDNLLQPNYPGAKCIVYQNAEGSGMDSAVMFELTCPQSANSPECNPFDAELGTTFELAANNPGFNPASPFPGWLKGRGPNPAHPCTPAPSNSPALFLSNQITQFFLTATDPKTRGGSGGTGSCWVATYNQPDEVPPAIAISSPTNTTYTPGQVVAASYTCSDPSSSKPTSSTVGPYLTAVSCQQSTDAQPPATATCVQGTGAINCTGTVDTSALGQHTFVVTARDSGKNTATSSVTYTVAAPDADVAILKVAPLTVSTKKKLTYSIGATNFGPNAAGNVVITDPLPGGTSFVSGSGKNIGCAVVNRRLVCTTTPFSCSAAGNVVTCNIGDLDPLSWSALNGATLQITVQVNAASGTVLRNTATVGSSNSDPNPGNNSSTAITLVTR